MIAWFIVVMVIVVTLSVINEGRKYEAYIRKNAEEKEFGEILNAIAEDDGLIQSGTFKGMMLDMLEDHMDMWEQILERKEEIEGRPGMYSSHRELWPGVVARWKEGRQ